MDLRSRFACLAGTIALILASAATLYAQSATLAWDANTEPDIAGYRIYYGTKSGQYTQSVNVGKATQYTVSGLDQSLNYYFAVQAYDTAGLASPLSAEVAKLAAVPPGTTTITSLKASTGYPLLVGNTMSWTTSATSKLGPVEYKYVMYSQSTGWKVVQDYTQNATFTWTPGWSDLGAHSLQVWARTVGSTAVYEAWVGTAFSVNASAVQITADVDFPTPPNNTVHWTTSVAGSSVTTLEYKYLLLTMSTGTWSVLRDWATDSKASWTPTAVGNYTIQVWARQVGSTAAYDVWGGTGTLSVARTTPTVTRVTANVAFPAATGIPITWTARVKGGQAGPMQYEFIRYSARTGWVIVKPYSTSNTYSWTPQWGDEDTYTMQVWVRNAGSTAPYDAWGSTGTFTIVKAPVRITVDTAFPAPPGTAVTIAAQVADPSATFEYQFWLYTRATGQWSVLQPYGSSNSITWTPAVAGTYAIQAWARRVGSTAQYDVWGSTGYLTIASGPASIASLTSNPLAPYSVGASITWTATGVGGTASPLQYKWLLYTEGSGWSVPQDWSTQNTFTWTPAAADAGNHALQVWVRSAGSTAAYEGWKGTGYFIVGP